MSERCNKCGGTGTIEMPRCTAPTSPCPTCGGTGLDVTTMPCAGCIALQQEVERLRYALHDLAYQHSYVPLGPCVCHQHEEARRLLGHHCDTPPIAKAKDGGL